MDPAPSSSRPLGPLVQVLWRQLQAHAPSVFHHVQTSTVEHVQVTITKSLVQRIASSLLHARPTGSLFQIACFHMSLHGPSWLQSSILWVRAMLSEVDIHPQAHHQRSNDYATALSLRVFHQWRRWWWKPHRPAVAPPFVRSPVPFVSHRLKKDAVYHPTNNTSCIQWLALPWLQALVHATILQHMLLPFAVC